MQLSSRVRRICTVLAAAIVGAAIALPAGARDWEGQKLPIPTNFIVGYGSLINSTSRNSTAATVIPAIPVRVSASFGYIRSWNSRSEAFTALGLRKPQPGEPGATINGVLCPVEDAELQEYDARENHYRRVEVPPSQIEAVGWQRLPAAGHLWIYVPRDASGAVGQGVAAAGAAAAGAEADAEHPLLQSYIDVVVEGGLEYGQDFAREIIETSDGWSRFWLNDRELARRPLQVLDPKAAKVDELLKTTLTATQLSARTFPEMYSETVRRATAK